jgi:hypothetical protein
MGKDTTLPSADAAQRVVVETAGQAARRAYGEWIVDTLRNYWTAQPGEDPTSLDFFGESVRLEGTMYDTLGTAYESHVPEDLKPVFRQAIGDAITNIASKTDMPSVDALDDLIHLVEKIKPTEALIPLASVVGDGEIGRQSESFLHETIEVLATFSALKDSPEIEDIVARVTAARAAGMLISGSNFDNDCILSATAVMVTCDPKYATDAVRKHAEHFARFRKKHGLTGGEAQVEYEEGIASWIAIFDRANPTVVNDKAQHAEVLAIVKG